MHAMSSSETVSVGSLHKCASTAVIKPHRRTSADSILTIAMPTTYVLSAIMLIEGRVTASNVVASFDVLCVSDEGQVELLGDRPHSSGMQQCSG